MFMMVLGALFGFGRNGGSCEMSDELKKECDYMACQQMRDSGWSEDEIKEFAYKHGDYYDREDEFESSVRVSRYRREHGE